MQRMARPTATAGTCIVRFRDISIQTRSKTPDAHPANPRPLSMRVFDAHPTWILNILGHRPFLTLAHQAESSQPASEQVGQNFQCPSPWATCNFCTGAGRLASLGAFGHLLTARCQLSRSATSGSRTRGPTPLPAAFAGSTRALRPTEPSPQPATRPSGNDGHAPRSPQLATTPGGRPCRTRHAL